MHTNRADIIKASIYFLLSIILTGVFITSKFWLYPSFNKMMISGAIASIKWAIQLVAAFELLKEKRWPFIRRMGFVCFVGSCLLFLYNAMVFVHLPITGFQQFGLTIFISVGVMVWLYYIAVKKSALPIRWFVVWAVCVALAIILQLTVVFDVFNFWTNI